MSTKYDLIQRYENSGPYINMAPSWVIAVFKFQYPSIFDRSSNPMGSSKSYSSIDTAQSPLIIRDCISLNINSNKNSHISSMSAVLADGTNNYLSQIFPEDWVMAWIVNGDDTADNLVQDLKNGRQVNGFDSGLKFLGRVQSISKTMSVDDEGRQSSMYSLSCAGFIEFDYQMFWEPEQSIMDHFPVWMQRVGLAIKDITNGDSSDSYSSDASKNKPNHKSVNINKIVPALIAILLGNGPFKNGNVQLPNGYGPASYNDGVFVPPSVATALGIDKGNPNYSDLLSVIIGVQKYDSAGLTNSPDALAPNNLTFLPYDSQSTDLSGYTKTNIDLLGDFYPAITPFQFTPIWQLLEQYKNSSVNEMYVSLSPVGALGYILPKFTLRQLPFSSEEFAGLKQSTLINGETVNRPPVTTYLELPRWLIDPKMLKSIQIGRTNSLRFNLFHIEGTAPATGVDQRVQTAYSAPLVDKDDISRAGLRSFNPTINCMFDYSVTLWRDIIADILAGQQLTLSGTIQTIGIYDPISIGDNIQYFGTVMHVESLLHRCNMSLEGTRIFETTMQFTHGYADEEIVNDNSAKGVPDTMKIYSGMGTGDGSVPSVGKTNYSTYFDNTGASTNGASDGEPQVPTSNGVA